MAQLFQQQVNGPSIVPCAKHDSTKDAEALHEAMNYKKVDKKTIIKILTTRSNAQLQDVRQAYLEIYNNDLLKEIKDKTSGDFEKAAVALLLERSAYEAKCVEGAVKGVGTNEATLIEIICTRTADQLNKIIKAYNGKLVDTIKDETSGDFQKLLITCLTKRNPECKTNANDAAKEAQLLYSKGEKKWGTDEQTFIDILGSRNFGQIALIVSEYEKISDNTLLAAIESEMGGDLAKGLIAIIKNARDSAGFWAEQIRETMKGLGTDEDKLIRIMVCAAEINLKSVRNAFGDRYGEGKNMLDWIKSDTTGRFEDILVAICLGSEQK